MTMCKENLLITGSFGNAVLRRFLKTDKFKEIRIFSRDEKKQDDLRQFVKYMMSCFFVKDYSNA